MMCYIVWMLAAAASDIITDLALSGSQDKGISNINIKYKYKI